jgi:KDO2-lipid IV(A) lauroyltransferase
MRVRKQLKRPLLKIRFSGEYALASSALTLLDKASLTAALKTGAALADLWYCFDFRRRRLAASNIRRAGIAATRVEAAKTARQSFRHFAYVLVESIKAREVMGSDNWQDFVELNIPDETMDLLQERGRGVLLVSGHLGNWEIAAHILSYIKPVAGITRPMKNPLVEQLVQQRKPGRDFTTIPKRNSNPRRFLDVLRRGHVLALLMDQYAREKGASIPFFGHPASTHTSPAMLHLVTRTPVCFGCCIRTAPLSYRLIASEPLVFERSGNKKDDVNRILTRLNGLLEDAIRKYPEQYLWAHRRWR